MNGQAAFEKVLNLMQVGVGILGALLIVWGAVKVGLALKEQQGGNAIAEGVGFLLGGAIISAAALYFGQVDISGLFS